MTTLTAEPRAGKNPTAPSAFYENTPTYAEFRHEKLTEMDSQRNGMRDEFALAREHEQQAKTIADKLSAQTGADVRDTWSQVFQIEEHIADIAWRNANEDIGVGTGDCGKAERQQFFDVAVKKVSTIYEALINEVGRFRADSRMAYLIARTEFNNAANIRLVADRKKTLDTELAVATLDAVLALRSGKYAYDTQGHQFFEAATVAKAHTQSLLSVSELITTPIFVAALKPTLERRLRASSKLLELPLRDGAKLLAALAKKRNSKQAPKTLPTLGNTRNWQSKTADYPTPDWQTNASALTSRPALFFV